MRKKVISMLMILVLVLGFSVVTYAVIDGKDPLPETPIILVCELP